MKIQLKYFGKIVDVTGVTEEEWRCAAPRTLQELKEELTVKYPALRQEVYKFAVNLSLEDLDYVVKEPCEIAVLPPFSGG
jgi:molybdopterin converting factor small subunit